MRQLSPGEAHVWRVRLEQGAFPSPTEEEFARAARFHLEESRRNYLRSHAALRAILAEFTGEPLEFSAAQHGKPYLANSPELKFNLSHSHGAALIGVALSHDIGVDVERLRPVTDAAAVAARFFPPSEAAAFESVPPASREVEFLRRWTRIEAKLKAQGSGLFGSIADLGGEWTVQEIDFGPGFAAAVAVAAAGVMVCAHEFSSGG